MSDLLSKIPSMSLFEIFEAVQEAYPNLNPDFEEDRQTCLEIGLAIFKWAREYEGPSTGAESGMFSLFGQLIQTVLRTAEIEAIKAGELEEVMIKLGSASCTRMSAEESLGKLLSQMQNLEDSLK